MLNNKMKAYTLYAPVVTTNEYNEKITTYQLENTIEAAISLNTHAAYNSNDTRIINCEYVAYTKYKSIEKGMRIDSCYTVEYVIEHKNGAYAFLKEIENNGRI